MTEAGAQQWLRVAQHVPRETMELLTRFVAYLIEATARQNLIAASTIEQIWTRHIVDSAQLMAFARRGSWIDLGTGAGFPGLVVAVLRKEPTTLVESRRKRAEFLGAAITLLELSARVRVEARRAELIDPLPYATISARAFAPLETLLAIGLRFAGPETRWILPKGRSAQAELDAAQRTWQGDFRIEPSITDPGSAIIIAERVSPRKQR